MTASTGWSLQRGIYQALANSSELGALLGGTRIYDDPPQAASYPFISLGQSLVRDWSTGTEDGAEHLLTLHVWSRTGGKKQVPHDHNRDGTDKPFFRAVEAAQAEIANLNA